VTKEERGTIEEGRVGNVQKIGLIGGKREESYFLLTHNPTHWACTKGRPLQL